MRGVLIEKIVFCLVMMAPSVAQSQPVVMIPSGVAIGEGHSHPVWNTVILEASANLSEGATDRLSSIAQDNAKLFGFTMMASVDRSSKANPFIGAVGVAMTIKSEQGTITVASEAKQGRDLGFISRMVLSAHEKALEKIIVLKAHPKYVLIQAPTIMHFQGKNQEMDVRYLILLDQQSQLKSYVWRVLKIKDDHEIMPFYIREFDPGVEDKRNFHVDGKKITFGIPSKMAFGLIDLPPGIDIKINDPKVKNLAVAETVDEEGINSLIKVLTAKVD